LRRFGAKKRPKSLKNGQKWHFLPLKNPNCNRYVQEIGRAGRDGGAALCHAFFSETDRLRVRRIFFLIFLKVILFFIGFFFSAFTVFFFLVFFESVLGRLKNKSLKKKKKKIYLFYKKIMIFFFQKKLTTPLKHL
jgi:hypothetical protein